MASGEGNEEPDVGTTLRPDASFPFREGKLIPPPIRQGVVERPRLVDTLIRGGPGSVVVVSAPAGYGKTTLLVQAHRADTRRVCWLSLDEQDNDPAVLGSYLATAFERACHSSGLPLLASPAAWTRPDAKDAFLSAVGTLPEPAALFVDDLHAVWNAESLDLLFALGDHMSPGSSLVLASREDPGTRIGRWRVNGLLREVGVSEMMMGPIEAAQLMHAAGASIDGAQAQELTVRTEGWAAALYLAALSSRAGGRAQPSRTFSGEDRFMADFLRSEFLEGFTDDEIAFLTRTSVLSSMNGRLCDVVLETEGSAQTLHRLEDANLLVVPLDRHREWYRYHHLFQEMLRAELDVREPGSARVLSQRAMQWLESQGMDEAAIEYAFASDDMDKAARLVGRTALPAVWSGRIATARQWLSRFDDRSLIRWPTLAVEGAWAFALLGMPADASRMAALAERGSDHAEPVDGSASTGSSKARLRAIMGCGSIEDTLRDARFAADQEPEWGLWRPSSLLVLGQAQLMAGDADGADDTFAEAAELAAGAGAAPGLMVALGRRASLAIDVDDWHSAEAFAEGSMGIVREAGLKRFPLSALTYSVQALIASHHSAKEDAQAAVERGLELAPRVTYALPWAAVSVRTELARVALALADHACAEGMLAEIEVIVRRRPHVGALLGPVEAIRTRLQASRDGLRSGGLTPAELRLLPMLPTHLSFAEIGAALYVSRSTIKTQAISIYRKLGVSSRGEAVGRAREMGLLEG